MPFSFVLKVVLPRFFGIVKTLEALKTQTFFTATVSPQVDVEFLRKLCIGMCENQPEYL